MQPEDSLAKAELIPCELLSIIFEKFLDARLQSKDDDDDAQPNEEAKRVCKALSAVVS